MEQEAEGEQQQTPTKSLSAEQEAVSPTSVSQLPTTSLLEQSTSQAEEDIKLSDKEAIKKGSALRWKYRYKREDSDSGGHARPAPPKRRRLEPNSVGWHPMNRNGKKPQPNRCDQLLDDLLGKFDPEQGDHNAVAVEENPNTPRRFLDHTLKVCANEERLAAPNTTAMVAAAVGHSHVNQLLRNAQNAALCELKSLGRVCDSRKRLQLQMIRGVDANLAVAIREGLNWELLSYMLEVEEPRDGVACVQMTLNDAQSVAMAKYEMQAVAHIETVILTKEKELLAPGSLTITEDGAARTRMLTMDQVEEWRKQTAGAGFSELALSPDFPGVLNLVIGTCKGPWLRKMLDWHSHFINSKNRQIPFSTIAGFGLLPLDKPRVRHALFVKAWDKKPGAGTSMVNVVSLSQLKMIAQPRNGCALQQVAQLILPQCVLF